MLDVDYYIKQFGDLPKMDELTYVNSTKLFEKSVKLQKDKNTKYTDT